MHVDHVSGIHAGRHRRKSGPRPPRVVPLERPQVAEVEDCPEVHVEPLSPLAGEAPCALADVGDGGAGQGRVVGRRQRADVAGRTREVGTQDRDALFGHVDPLQRIGLDPVPVGAAQTRDGPYVVEEVGRITQRGGELELIDDVGDAVAVIVDVDFVEDVIPELVEVRPAIRALQREVVGDQGDRLGRVRTDKGVDVRAVGDGVL